MDSDLDHHVLGLVLTVSYLSIPIVLGFLNICAMVVIRCEVKLGGILVQQS